MNKIIKILPLLIFLFSFQALSQSSFDLLLDFTNESFIEFEYKYEEFDQNAYLDSTIILTSFNGTKTVFIDSIMYFTDSVKYMLRIKKEGVRIKRTFLDTLSIENIKTVSNDMIVENITLKERGASNYIYGWIFNDSLIKSVSDTLDTIPPYPYSKIYRYYYPEQDDSLFVINDTLYIHYRPETTNYFDSYFSKDFHVERNHGFTKEFKYYSYYGGGFSEEYTKVGVGIIENIDYPPINSVKDFYLYQNYPNPFNPFTNIRFHLKRPFNVFLGIYDSSGKLIKTLISNKRLNGSIDIQWDGTNNHCKAVSSGIYIYTLKTKSMSVSKKMVLIR